MDTLPLPQTRNKSHPHQPSHHKSAQSQTTIESHLRPVVTIKRDQNDIRNYFPPVIKTQVIQNGKSSKLSSPAEPPQISRVGNNENGAVTCQKPTPSRHAKTATENQDSFPDCRQYCKQAPRNHIHSNSAVLPKFDPYFDNTRFTHTTSPMAPRVTDVVRYSLIPKPLNIKLPPPPPETIQSPSQATSSPSSIGDPDTPSFHEQSRGAPSFKQTYSGVHSRHNTNDSPMSPLAASYDPIAQSSRPRVDRPATLRAKTMPQLSEPDFTDSVIYFLPSISPTSESSDDDRKPLLKRKSRQETDKAPVRSAYKPKTHAVKFENDLGQPGKRRDGRDVTKQKPMTASPGKQVDSAFKIEV